VSTSIIPHALSEMPAQVNGQPGYATRLQPGSDVEAVYDYTDPQGSVLFQVVRFRPKAFLTRRVWSDGSWSWGLNDVTPMLYRLPRVCAAGTVLVLEGEKDVETAERLGLPEGWAATCNPFGVCMWKPEYSAALAGKRVVLCPDTDLYGETHLHSVGMALVGHASCMLLVRLPHSVKDLSQWVEAGGGPSEFKALLHGAEPLVYPRPDAERVRVTAGIDGALDHLLELRGVCDMTGEDGDSGPMFMPHEVARVFPEWIGELEDGRPFVAIKGFEALTTMALRELRDGADRIAARLDALERRLCTAERDTPRPERGDDLAPAPETAAP
jgi:hypothetical protein